MKYAAFVFGLLVGGYVRAGVVAGVTALFDQAENLDFCLEEAREFAQRAPIYDVFQTIDIIYAVPAIPLVESAYQLLRRADEESTKCGVGCAGTDCAEKEKPCCVACTENVRLITKNKATFYVLMDGESARRNFSLCSGDQCWKPELVQSFDDVYRLGILCGGKARRFYKNAYQVIFNTEFVPDRSYTLVVAAGRYRVQICWDDLPCTGSGICSGQECSCA
jgi:hypothetical protein